MKQLTKKKELFKIIWSKLAWTGLILVVYDLGKNIPLPFVQVSKLNKMSQSASLLSLSGSATGANLTQVSLFSLGLSPWMSAIIIWQLLLMIKGLSFDKLSKKETDFFQLLLTLVIALIEAWGMIVSLPIIVTGVLEKIIVSLVVVAGSFWLIWLANMNSVKGIGGSITVILFGILGNVIQQVTEIIRPHTLILVILICSLIFLLIISLTVIVEQTEYHVKIQQIMIESHFSDQTYLPIKLNPGGSMSIMFSLSLLMLPNYLLQILHQQFPDNSIIVWLIKNVALTSYFGVSLYILILFGLTLVFGLVNVDPEKIAEDLQKAGDYLIKVNPGKDTEVYLRQKVLQLSVLGAIYTVAFAGVPLFFGVGRTQLLNVLLLPGMLMMTCSMVLMIIEQFRTISLLHGYADLLDFSRGGN
ncbi:accessory Sec system protein translocase subunit SecY2 [Liquorilactobacillus sicerae]|uniref:accessory Sec system protein translocase subunit SecY2 n=1 Tax=Liquorilactobacillus sicerae TaxID=1416943 RepID=UPI0024806BA8|nr:accessory Sec system protein translocase subunit SecY2 [Liquorilactobacillus sicerae]